ncbi:FixH family protein [Amorphus orientalis]|uniref:Nitrogen fixation protein FixH n=1 Tax=Amorphus orientalis TaxID=649198 RepID=A0AAE3VQN0_9HYPH|nr:FixH family protein [Amorphus orientalis]MDQ0316173.1 nitrogen fixation protein FixH [Amorphus orientalis]
MAIMTANRQHSGFRITGRKVFFGLVAFFGIIMAANVVLIWLAIGSFPGVVTDSAYQAGREYPEFLAAAERQRELGWQVNESLSVAGPDQPLTLRINADDRDDAPLSGLAVLARLSSPTHEGLDREARLLEGETGVYQGHMAGLPAGQYDLEIELTAGNGDSFRSVNRLVISENGVVR